MIFISARIETSLEESSAENRTARMFASTKRKMPNATNPEMATASITSRRVTPLEKTAVSAQVLDEFPHALPDKRLTLEIKTRTLFCLDHIKGECF